MFESRKNHSQCSQILASTIVQLTCNAPAFLVLSKHQFYGKVSKLIRLVKDLEYFAAPTL